MKRSWRRDIDRDGDLGGDPGCGGFPDRRREFCPESARVRFNSNLTPSSLDQFRELYKKYAKGLLTEEQLEWTANIILNLEQYKDLQEFMDVLTYRYALRR